MNRLASLKSLAAAAIVLGAFGAASAAHARSDVVLSIGVNAPYGYTQPQPVYVQPQPVYVEPQPVYVQPRTVYAQPAYGTVIYERGWRDSEWRHRRHGWREHGPYGDRDHDGVPNRYDRAPNNFYRY